MNAKHVKVHLGFWFGLSCPIACIWQNSHECFPYGKSVNYPEMILWGLFFGVGIGGGFFFMF